jgi:hypothetical protein
MPLNDRVRFLKRLKELRRFGYCPEYALRRATQEDSELFGGPPDRSPLRGGDDPPRLSPSPRSERNFGTKWRDPRTVPRRNGEGHSGSIPKGRTKSRGDGREVATRTGLCPHPQRRRLDRSSPYRGLRDHEHGGARPSSYFDPIREQLGIDTSKAWWKDSWRPKK